MAGRVGVISSPEEMEKKIKTFNDELKQLELTHEENEAEPERERKRKRIDEIETEIEERPEQRQKLISELEQWGQKAGSYFRCHLTPYLSSSFFRCHKILHLLHNIVDLNFPTRTKSLYSKLTGPLPLNEPQHEEEDNLDTAAAVFKMSVESAEGMLGEILLDLEQEQIQQEASSSSSSSSKRMTLTEYLAKEDEIVQPFEFARIRLRAVLVGIQLSKLLARYMLSLSDNNDEEMLENFVSKINKFAEKKREENNTNVVAGKFVEVIDATKVVILNHKQQKNTNKKKKKKKKKMMMMKKKKKEVQSENDLALENPVIKQFCRGISLLGFILCDEIVPKKNTSVNGARVRVEGILGLILFDMQGLRLSIAKNNNHADSWMELKDHISSIWKIENYKC